jgi:SpoVK/Ycf46/Vps4 family AAA+-type ATPase
MRNRIVNYIRAGYPALYLVSSEETRVEAEMLAAARELGYSLWEWSPTSGYMNAEDGRHISSEDPLTAVTVMSETGENSIALLRDFHLYLESGDPTLIAAVKDELAVAKTRGRVAVVLACRLALPPELSREFVVLDFDLPDAETLGQALDGVCESAGLPVPRGDERAVVLESAAGMTCAEAENAFALSVVELKTVDAMTVAREKAASLRRDGAVEIIEVRESLEDVGGLDVLKTWLRQRRLAFGERARQYRLPRPKGVLLLGVPGTGKSLTAKAAARVFGRPLLRLDMGAVMGGLVGESEANLRSAIRIAETMAPCLLWIDELDKGLSGSRSSASSDGGTAARVFGGFVSWLQEKTAPVFVVATANDVSALPPELLRKGRWDEIFWTDLPTAVERRAIWSLKLAATGRDPSGFDLDALVRDSEGLTGAEIEAAVGDALYRAFAEDREPRTADVSAALRDTVPLSKLSDAVDVLRKWARGRARPATTPETPDARRRIAA